MQFFVYSGTDILPFVERCNSAALALEVVNGLLARRLPNIRIFSEGGEYVDLTALVQLAAEENETDDA